MADEIKDNITDWVNDITDGDINTWLDNVTSDLNTTVLGQVVDDNYEEIKNLVKNQLGIIEDDNNNTVSVDKNYGEVYTDYNKLTDGDW